MATFTIEYEERAVAFIDILGFKNIVNRSAEDEEMMKVLNELVELLQTSIPSLNSNVDANFPKDLIPQHIYISDCIILSAPLRSEEIPKYCGLAAIVMRAIQVSQKLLDHGFLVSGGITIGKVWHSSRNIVGPAYQEAYLLESRNSLPCIVLSSCAESYWRNSWLNSSTMCIQRKNKTFVNLFNEYYYENNDQHGEIERKQERYNQLISSQLNSQLTCKPKLKWLWISILLNLTCKT